MFITVLVYLTSPVPSNSNWGFPDGSIFYHFPPYMLTEIRKFRFFAIFFCVLNLPWYTHSSFARIQTLSILPWYTFSQWKWHKKMMINVSFSVLCQIFFCYYFYCCRLFFSSPFTVLVYSMSPPPSNSNWGFPDGSIFHHFLPYMITEIRKIRFFVIFSVINLPWFTHSSFCPDIFIHSFDFALMVILSMKMT